MKLLGKKAKNVEAPDVAQKNERKQLGVEIRMPGCENFVPIGPWQVKRVYSDDIGPRCLCVLDEVAELIEPSGIKSQEGKEEDAIKQEIVSLVKSITQLGRSSGMHCILAPLSVDTPVPTPDGWKVMGDLKPGDVVFDHNGDPVNVLDVSPVKMSKGMYQLELEGYEKVGGQLVKTGKHLSVHADGDHCFPVSIGWADAAFKMKVEDVVVNMNVINHHMKEFDIKHEVFVMGVGDVSVRWKVELVQLEPDEEVVCILVDHPKHQFLIGDGKAVKRWEEEQDSGKMTKEWLKKNCAISYNTQRNDASIIPGVIQNNSLSLDTKLRIRREVSDDAK